ncbi:MAG: hypothetical protein ACFFB0_13310 [Promethearchaeota archaeon]
MKEKLKSQLISILLISGLFFSVLYFISYLKIVKLKNRDEKLCHFQNYYYVDIYDVNMPFESLYKRSLEEILLNEINFLYGSLIERFENVYNIIFAFGTSTFFIFLEFNNNFILSKKSEGCLLYEIEGVLLTEEEIKVFRLIEEQLKQNRIFNIEKAITYIQSRYNKIKGNLNYNGIMEVINSLIKKKIIVEGSKLTRKTVLLNSNRNDIYNLIKLNPGIYVNRLAKTLKISCFVIKWHIHMLLKFNLIRQRNLNGHISYYDNLLTPTNDIIFHIISKEKCVRIIELLKSNNNGVTKYQISKQLRMHYNTIVKYLDNLDAFNLLIRKENNNREYFFLNTMNFENLILKGEN